MSHDTGVFGLWYFYEMKTIKLWVSVLFVVCLYLKLWDIHFFTRTFQMAQCVLTRGSHILTLPH